MNYFYNTFEFIPKAGETIDDNVVLSEIGEGGRSRVYKVKNMSLEVERVVKLLKKPSEIDEERFVTEARISANLNHPNIVQCYRFSKYNDELPYIEMEFVDGHDLHYLIRKNIRLPYKIVLAILHYVCEALKVLHNCEYMLYDVKRHGVVHRDIKPGNILISRKGEVKLADFGIAKPKDLTIHTTEMQVVGTVYYLSPEQIRREELDFSTDIYSLGCVMYEMITGKKAFRHKNLMDVMEAKKSSTYDKDAMAVVPKAFQEIIHKCMAPDRLSRYLNINELQEEIDRLLKKEGVYNLKAMISDYVQDPETYTAIQRVRTKKAKQLSRTIPLLFLSIGTICLLMALGFYVVFNENNISSVELKKDIQQNKQPVEKVKQSVIEKPVTESKKEQPVVAVKKKSNKKQNKDTVKKVVTNTEIIKTIENIDVKEVIPDSRVDILSDFLSRDFESTLSQVYRFNNLNDTLKLCLAGSMVETGTVVKASKYLSKITVNDGYLFYLKGRVAQSKGEFKKAAKHYLASLTKPSFNKHVRALSNYQVALCREEIYKIQPNSVNRNSMIKAYDLFLRHYCNNASTTKCNVIRSLKKQYD